MSGGLEIELLDGQNPNALAIFLRVTGLGLAAFSIWA